MSKNKAFTPEHQFGYVDFESVNTKLNTTFSNILGSFSVRAWKIGMLYNAVMIGSELGSGQITGEQTSYISPAPGVEEWYGTAAVVAGTAAYIASKYIDHSKQNTNNLPHSGAM